MEAALGRSGRFLLTFLVKRARCKVQGARCICVVHPIRFKSALQRLKRYRRITSTHSSGPIPVPLFASPVPPAGQRMQRQCLPSVNEVDLAVWGWSYDYPGPLKSPSSVARELRDPPTGASRTLSHKRQPGEPPDLDIGLHMHAPRDRLYGRAQDLPQHLIFKVHSISWEQTERFYVRNGEVPQCAVTPVLWIADRFAGKECFSQSANCRAVPGSAVAHDCRAFQLPSNCRPSKPKRLGAPSLHHKFAAIRSYLEPGNRQSGTPRRPASTLSLPWSKAGQWTSGSLH